MKIKTFEDFLKEKHAEQYTGLDDEMPDDYDEWLYDKIGRDDIIRYAEELIKIIEKEIKQNLTK